MADTKRVRYVKIDLGRFFYQRRVPKDLQADLRERMTPQDVRERSIHVHGSKTDGSDRIVPLHRTLSDFPAWIASGGMPVFDSL